MPYPRAAFQTLPLHCILDDDDKEGELELWFAQIVGKHDDTSYSGVYLEKYKSPGYCSLCPPSPIDPGLRHVIFYFTVLHPALPQVS